MIPPSPLLAIVGETASGKSVLAMAIAKQFKGEIICADSRTIYKGLDILTAKPTEKDQAEVQHHLLSIIDPKTPMTAFEFKSRTEQAIDLIHQRGNLPLLVGGSGLYIDAVLFDLQFAAKPTPQLREELNNLSLDELAQRALAYPGGELIDPKNKRHLARFLEAGGIMPAQVKVLRPDTMVIGITRTRAELRSRIEKRAETMFRRGLRKEFDRFIGQYGWDTCNLTGYTRTLFSNHSQGLISTSQLKRQLVQGDLHLAKRQRTWFKRNPYIQWFSDDQEALDYVKKFMQGYAPN